jgi:hypothetical protein
MEAFMSVAKSRSQKQRHTASNPCPVCRGHDGAARGQGERCHGFTSGDWVHCSRESSATPGNKFNPESQTYLHRLAGPCPCGQEHRPAEAEPAANRRNTEAIYDYRDADGKLIFQTVRTRPKSFRQRRPDPTARDGFVWNLKGVALVPYRLPELLAADHSQPVFIVEGEKDADRLAKFELIATTNPMGAGKWRHEYSAYLRGRDVVILPDNDQAGEEHAQKIAKFLSGIARSIKIVTLPGLPEKGDVSDWLNGKNTIADLKRFAVSAALWSPQEGVAQGGPPTILKHPKTDADQDKGPRFANYVELPNEEGDLSKVALRVAAIDANLHSFAGDWPKRKQNMLFVESSKHTPVYLQSPAQFFAWIDNTAQVDWTKGSKYITQERCFEHQRMEAPSCESVETLPHWPPLPDVCYMFESLPKASGKLDELVDAFTPATAVDRELILALILTLFWGGPPGRRPAFLITGPDDDEGQGRGVGKTALVQILAEGLAGGYMDVSPTDQIATVKTRLLSEAGSQARVAMLDNIKTLRFSWSDLEGLITSSEISGRALYVGEGRRPNTLLWVITLNGASLSKDMAQRVICIKLGRPAYTRGWEHGVRSFIAKNRLAILAEIRDILEAEARPLASNTRWSEWESSILSKLSESERCQRVIAERQDSIDDDNEERDLVAEQFKNELHRCRVDPESDKVFITASIAARWVNRATNRSMPTNRASSYLKGLAIAELRKTKQRGVLGWIWMGPDAISKPNEEMARVDDPEEPTPQRPDNTALAF